MRRKTKNLLGGLATAIIGLLGIGTLVLHTINKVRTGHGIDYYLTGEGVQMNYIGALIAIAVAAVALLAGWIVRLWSQRRDAWPIKGSKIHKGKKQKT